MIEFSRRRRRMARRPARQGWSSRRSMRKEGSMSDSPWLDIPPKENVKAALLDGGGSRGSKYESVVRAVEQYQAVSKDEHPQFITRAMLLWKVSEACLAARGQANSASH